ncbi:MFS transporter [Motiliproteus sp.]|uniref:MFS transporter n=1 Tax=Motiliproteus sp. TaxID=1898955 RepID=UPI003BAA0632
MRLTLLSFASLFISCFIMMLGNGLINILLPVRMGMDQLGTDTIGMVLSLYFVGMLLGGIYARLLIRRAGHIRMFAGCLALAAVSILVCSLASDPILWAAMRILIGFCNACAYTAMESWLSESSTKETRGKVLAFYQVVTLVALFCGQFLINLASPAGTVLFVLSGILLCASIVPIVLSRSSGPTVEEIEPMSLLALYRISPLGVVSCFVSGWIYSAAFNMLPVFADSYGIIDFQLSLYMGAAIMGAFLLQFPVGYLSDRFDRRTVLLASLIISAIAGFSVTLLADESLFWMMSVATGITCGIIACTYPLSISETFDKLRQSEMVAGMGCLILAFSLGGIVGPYSTSLVMEQFGNSSLFGFLGVLQLLLCVFVVYRMFAREALPADQQEKFVMQAAAIPPVVDLDPRTEYQEPDSPLSPEAELAAAVADTDPAAAIRMAKAVAINTPEQVAEMAGAMAAITAVDGLRLQEALIEAVPDQAAEITSAIVTANSELASDLIAQIATTLPSQVVEIATRIGTENPDLRVEMATAMIAADPESAVEVTEFYAKLMAEEHEAIRPADREEDTTDQAAVELVSSITELAPEQALDVAVTMVEAIPDTATQVTEEYVGNLSECQSDEVIEELIETVDSINTPEEAVQELNQEAVEFVSRISEAAPEQAVDVAVTVVEAIPEVASELIDELNERSDSDEIDMVMKLEDRPDNDQ